MEWLGAEQAVVGDEQIEFEDWLREAWSNNADHHATEIGMGQYMAGQTIAMAPETADAYRAVSELSRSHFGASALLTADGSHDKRFLVAWADEAFHLGWAQLLFGWQIVIQDRQCRFAVGSGLFGVESEDRQEYQRLHRQSQTILQDQRRCRAEWIIDQGRQRLLIDNYRRQPSGAPQANPAVTRPVYALRLPPSGDPRRVALAAIRASDRHKVRHSASTKVERTASLCDPASELILSYTPWRTS